LTDKPSERPDHDAEPPPDERLKFRPRRTPAHSTATGDPSKHGGPPVPHADLLRRLRVNPDADSPDDGTGDQPPPTD
jgi:hypothetical protein